jgi:hypothetical protein
MPKKTIKKHNITHKVGALEFKKLKENRLQWCLVEHRTKTEIKKSAMYSLTILGRPAGALCGPCMKEWTKIWEECSSVKTSM